MSYCSRIAVPSFGGGTDQYALYEITAHIVKNKRRNFGKIAPHFPRTSTCCLDCCDGSFGQTETVAA